MLGKRKEWIPASPVAWCALLAMGLLGGCAGPRLEIAAAPSQASVTLTDAGVRLTIVPNAWTGYPGDLGR